MKLSAYEIAQMIDLSAVRTNSSDAVVRELCTCAQQYGVYLATVLPAQTMLARECLGQKRQVKLGGNVGFPSGGQTTRIKAAEALELIEMGCDELDMVIDVAALISGRHQKVFTDLEAVVEAAGVKPVKAILECHFLDERQMLEACDLAIRAGAAFVKTGSGWAPSGAKLQDVALIRAHVQDEIGIKASGGIRDLETLLALHRAGASRFGISLQSGKALLGKLYSSKE